MDKDIFIVYLKADYIYKDITEDAETRFDTFQIINYILYINYKL